MPIKTILQPIRESDTHRELMETGVLAARRFNAHLDLLYVHPNPDELLPYATLGLSNGMKASVRESAIKAAEEQAGRLRAEFEGVCEKHGLPLRARGETPGQPSAAWNAESGIRNELIGRLGRLADVIIMPRPQKVSPPPQSFEAAVRESGRPVLIVPRKTVQSVLATRIAIGWNNSKEAAQAVAAARPCLQQAEAVTVLVTEKRASRRPSAQELVTYLKCHGVDATINLLDVRKQSVGEALLAHARDINTDLLVVGGYSRNRLRDMVMGGVTRHLLQNADLPVLLVH
ncbi:MAG: universal stress protein [Gammaproteobacteria bacterium]|nr:universal stress protein [Gammaproteobacteria bacterium]